jgi:hypothetical protein
MGVKKGVAPNRNFTQVPNDLIRDRKVSDGAFRLICWITSHSDGFDVSFSAIQSALGYGRDGLRSIIKNAEQNNYLVRARSRDPRTGQFDWDYHIFANKEDAIAFRQFIFEESIDAPTIDGFTTDGLATPGLPTGGSANGGSAHPHKEYKEEKKQSKENKEKEHTPANGDFGSKEPTPRPLEEKVSATLSKATDGEEMDVDPSSESKEVIAACDNKTVNLQSSAYKMEQRYKDRTLSAYPAYRTGSGRNGIKKDFLEWLVSSYLPTTPHYKGKNIEIISAKNWVGNKERDGLQGEVEERYEQMLSKQTAAKPNPESDDRAPLTPEQEVWVAIASHLEQVTGFVQVDIIPKQNFGGWYVRTNIGATLQGSLDSVMARLPLSAIQTKFAAYYPECYQLAKKKYPHLELPEPLAPSKRAS